MKITGNISTVLNRKGGCVWSISPDATVFEAIQLMAEKNVGALLVMSGAQLAGIVTERDYTRNVALKGKSSRETKVREIISHQLVAVTPEHSVEDCMKLMTEHRVRHLPVLAGDALIGVVSIGDLVNWTISAQNVALEQMEHYIAGVYPG